MIEFHPLAIQETRQAQSWYRQRSLSAAVRFMERLRHAIERLSAAPDSHPKIGLKEYRYVRIQGFPYVVVYVLRSDSSVLVIAMAHTSRRAGYWRRRE